jgi:hypothetical protein
MFESGASHHFQTYFKNIAILLKASIGFTITTIQLEPSPKLDQLQVYARS